MVIQLQKCRERPLDVRGTLDLSARFAHYPEIETIDPVHAELTVRSSGGQRFQVSGQVSAHLTAYCVRCLEPFPIDLANRFDLSFLPGSSRPRGGSGEGMMDEGEVDVSYYDDEQIEVLPLVEEQLNLALPMRLLCAPDCRGLCQYCGRNKNLTDCGCVAPAFDPRLEPLKGLRH